MLRMEQRYRLQSWRKWTFRFLQDHGHMDTWTCRKITQIYTENTKLIAQKDEARARPTWILVNIETKKESVTLCPNVSDIAEFIDSCTSFSGMNLSLDCLLEKLRTNCLEGKHRAARRGLWRCRQGPGLHSCARSWEECDELIWDFRYFALNSSSCLEF